MVFKNSADRWTVANILPVAFVLGIIGSIWITYIICHLARLHRSQDDSANFRGVWQTVISQVLVLHLMICYYRAVFTDPGSVPDEPEWKTSRSSTDPVGAGGKGSASSDCPANYEIKQNGERRFCKWCDHFKPDRAHHCRVCRNCVLRMDHHCPWICNCVGYRNYKFFFCLVITSLKASIFMAATSYESVRWSAEEQVEASYRFGIVYCLTISIVMSFVLLMFFLVHIYLMTHATSTIEFC